MNHKKYQHHPVLDFPQRTWPDERITKPPIWCSVDLRDGNQALETPMTLEQKLEFFKFLVKVGFKEIEVGFPAASDTEFQFVRTLIEDNLIPGDVTIQVLTQSREPIIRRTFESLKGVHKATVHLYNATSPLFRDVVFQKSRKETIELAVFGASLFNTLADEAGAERFVFEYSPECFSQTEPDYAVEVCNAVITCWESRKVIINLPFTVESAMPNVHADLLEYVCGKLLNRENIVVSLHAHNDRGTAVAATEMCLLAGADRVEGTLFGNGERTGNADLITLAFNLYSQGIDPGLDFSELDAAIAIYEKSTCLPVHPRHPYAGGLVYTAFSGSHQDAIRKGMVRMKDSPGSWNVPYLPIDPKDVGRSYDPIIRFNSQSGSSSVAYILETNYHIHIPKSLQRDFGPIVIDESNTKSAELSPAEIYELFNKAYVNLDIPVKLVSWQESHLLNDVGLITGILEVSGKRKPIRGRGSGIVEAFCQAISEIFSVACEVTHYSQHSMDSGAGAKARAITYVEINMGSDKFFGVGVSSNIATSSLLAVISAVNRFMGQVEH